MGRGKSNLQSASLNWVVLVFCYAQSVGTALLNQEEQVGPIWISELHKVPEINRNVK